MNLGRPTTLAKASPEELFWKRVAKTPTCWLWTGYKTKGGYGLLTVNSKSYTAQRFSWILHNGPIPFGLDVLHKCDNPPCVNPDHLFLGTQQDNVVDSVNKGRFRIRQGKGQKLTKSQVSHIKFLLGSGKSGASLARKFGVSRQSINYIKLGKTWRM